MKKTALLLAAAAALCTGGAWAATQSHPAHMKSTTTAAASTPAKGVWNWSMIDTNKDNLIEPSEMEQFLASHPGPLKKTTNG